MQENKAVIAIGCDHAGFERKNEVLNFLQKQNYRVTDKGTNSPDSVDYPDFAHAVAKAVESKEADIGILLCGSANGVCMTANKHPNIRAAVCWNKEIASLARQHNNANVICIPARFVSKETAEEMADVFLHTSFEEGRHTRRVQKIAFLDKLEIMI